MSRPSKTDELHSEIKKFENALVTGGQIVEGKRWLPAKLMDEVVKQMHDENWQACPYGTKPAPLIKPEPEPVKIVTSTGTQEFGEAKVKKVCFTLELFVQGESQYCHHLPVDPAYDLVSRLTRGRKEMEAAGLEMYYQNNPDKRPAKKASWFKVLCQSIKWALVSYGATQLVINLIRHAG